MELDKIERLASALRAIAAGTGPTEYELAQAQSMHVDRPPFSIMWTRIAIR